MRPRTLVGSALLILFGGASAAAGQNPDAADNEIVVRAVRGKCTVLRAGNPIGNRALDAFAQGWPAERPLRLIAPSGASYRCLAKIAFKLQQQGVRSIEFVDAAD